MTNANLELLHEKGVLLNYLLTLTPLTILCKYFPLIAEKLTIFHPTERLIEYSFIHENLPFGGKGRILDVGCGSSMLPFELASKGYIVYALDLERQYFKTCKHTNFTFVQSDIRTTNFPDNFFDAVTAVSSIEHIGLGSSRIDLNGDKKAMREIVRITRPGGKLIMTVPFGVSGLYYKNRAYPLWRVYDLQSLIELLSPLKIERVKFALLNDNMSWRPADLNEVERIDSLNQKRWISSKAIALVIALKKS